MKGIVVGNRERLVIHLLRVAAHPREVHVAQHATQISVNILDLLEACATQRKLNECILDQVFGARALLIGEAQSPAEQLFVALCKQLFSLLLWLWGQSLL